MKLLLCIILFFLNTVVAFSQMDCDNICVTDIAMNSEGNLLDITISNGSTQINYPIVMVVLDGDTVANINQEYYFFAQLPGQTTVHTVSTTLTSVPANFTCTVIIVDYSSSESCTLEYPCIPNSIFQVDHTKAIEIYPNPANDALTIQSTMNISWVVILDATGRKVFSANTNCYRTQLNVQDLNPGAYIAEIHTTNQLIYRTQFIRN